MHPLEYKCPHCGEAVEVTPQSASEIVTCPNRACLRPFEVRVPVAIPESDDGHPLPVATPVLTMNATGSVGAAAEHAPVATAVLDGQPATAAAAPPRSTGQESPAVVQSEQEAGEADPVEETVSVVHPVMFWRYPLRFLVLLTLLGSGLWVAWQAYLKPNYVYILGAFAAGLILYSLYHLISWWIRVCLTKVTITNKRTIVKKGGPFTAQKLEIQHKDLDSLHVHQDFWNRRFGVGDLAIYTNDPNGKKQIFVMAIPNPKGVAEQIRAQVQVPQDTAQQPTPA